MVLAPPCFHNERMGCNYASNKLFSSIAVCIRCVDYMFYYQISYNCFIYFFQKNVHEIWLKLLSSTLFVGLFKIVVRLILSVT
jgi:hypothetical protein